jgi:hypothetical protein
VTRDIRDELTDLVQQFIDTAGDDPTQRDEI